MYAYARTKYTKCNRVSSTGQRKPSWWFSSPYLHLNAPKFMESHFQRHSNAHAMMPSKSLLKFNLKNSQNKEKPLIFQIASSPFSISSRCLFPGKASSSIIWAMHPAKLWKVANSFICRYLHPLTTRSPCFDSTLLQILSQPQKTRKRQGWTRHKTCT